MSGDDILEERRTFCLERLDKIRDQIGEMRSVQRLSDLSIYVTGSYGRLEASEYSDLDVFFVHDGSSPEDSVSNIDKTLMDADLIRMVRDLGLPEFSRDAEFLTIHYVEDICEALGSREDDYHNHFTARLLLLMESRPLWNEELYDELLERIIESYYRDYHDHEEDFRPVFLLNDIIRFWRTLCLNYEHRRHRNAEDEIKKQKNYLLNLKLRFSRLFTCYSTITSLVHRRDVVTPEDLTEVCDMTPLERLEEVDDHHPEVSDLIGQIREDYAWFLERTGRPKEKVLEWIGDKDNRNDAFQRSREFASRVYRLVRETTPDDSMRFLVV